VAIFGFWELYYRHFYPAWARWLIPLNVLLYGAIGLGMWWLALRLPGPAVLWPLICPCGRCGSWACCLN
jgi:hypothetical protein